MNIVDEIKSTFKSGSLLIRLIYINLGVFLLVKVTEILFFFFNRSGAWDIFFNWMAVPVDLSKLILRPWTLITYNFLHLEFLHILFNLLWLFSFGRLFLYYLDSKKLLSTYMLGGLSGGLLYIIVFNLFPLFEPVREISVALGASASVMAIVVAISTYAPNHHVYFPFLGNIKIKYIAIIFVISDLLLIYNRSSNLGGHIAHIGGALFGFYYIKQLRKGIDISTRFNRLMDSFFALFKKRTKMKVSYKKTETDMEYNARKVSEQKEIDRILDKIAKSGYESLSKNEKEQLFRQSGKK